MPTKNKKSSLGEGDPGSRRSRESSFSNSVNSRDLSVSSGDEDVELNQTIEFQDPADIVDHSTVRGRRRPPTASPKRNINVITKTDETSELNLPKEKFFFFAVTIAVACLAWFYLTPPSTPTSVKNFHSKTVNEQYYKEFINRAKKMITEKYSGLKKEQRAIISYIGRKAFLENDESPVVLIAAGKRSGDFVVDLNEVILESQSSNRIWNSIRIDENTNRADFHNRLNTTLASQVDDGLVVRGAAVTDIQKLTWDAVLVLHAFADHSSFIIKKTLLLLSVQGISAVENSDCESITFRHLEENWIQNGGNADNIPPILSRVAQNVICVPYFNYAKGKSIKAPKSATLDVSVSLDLAEALTSLMSILQLSQPLVVSSSTKYVDNNYHCVPTENCKTEVRHLASTSTGMNPKQLCNRCGKQVYPTDKVGPLKDSAYFHQGCFKCYICGTRLALKTYCNNRNDINDKEVYCANHVPIAGPHDLPLTGTRTTVETNNNNKSENYRRDAGLNDMKIAHAMKATQVAKPYPKINHEGAHYVVDYDAQTRLELLHRRDEDQLYETFQHRRAEESEQFENETREEWEKALADFAKKFEKGQAAAKSKDDLIRQLTIKREKKLETLHTKRRERERHQTAELVDRQAKEMLDLFKASRSEYCSDQYPSTPPPPMPPTCSKQEIYTSTEFFSSVDEVAMHCARHEVASFTDLIRTLSSGARSDVDIARAIYRWITIKNLNTMIFDESVQSDTPMGLLRGIKYGTESYHVLFKRLCSYAGLHCVVIKGFSKSAGYQPGYSFDDHLFRNTWNAVFLDGSWRFVQCNWGARHLVNAKDGTHEAKSDGNLRYEYDDHYFMTDPEEFIYEFYPSEQAWQLLPHPLSLDQFERIPFVRSLFFKYDLAFTDPRLESTIYTDRTGAATVSIRLPSNGDSLIFHYNLKFFDSEETTINGLSLKRFVMQSVTDDIVTFRVHAPSTRPLLLDIFANSVTSGAYLTGQPIKFKSVCKFKVICESLQVIMVPLPECASGEWGPAKATRLFGLLAASHPEAIINTGRHAEIRFRMTRPLSEFVASLHRNRTEDRALQNCTRTTLRGDVVSIQIEFPEEGQYGLDIYTRQDDQLINGKQLLTHCCKYLIHSRYS
ncbi:unnamed protein product [Caenorhabditis auriculariae]|uniref:LIM zinc-binding domain-containing protein n=1 Tax=Caenorhabditis auriculariae TaxID=2777116 RepID=A0A8S1H9L2_9PELO|nr:unnamed protein product [Caenorhabditis auriculariae]